MGISSDLRDDHVRVVTMDFPPVNALPVQGWFDLAAALDEAGRDQGTHAVVLRAEGRGFNAGVDIKEMQRTTGFDALIGANKGCYAAFKAVYECAVPVVAAVNGFCLGGGDRAGRQRRHGRGLATTPTSACPRSTAARSAPRRTWPGWCRRTSCARSTSPAAPSRPPTWCRTAASSRWSPASGSTTPRSPSPARSPPRTPA